MSPFQSIPLLHEAIDPVVAPSQFERHRPLADEQLYVWLPMGWEHVPLCRPRSMIEGGALLLRRALWRRGMTVQFLLHRAEPREVTAPSRWLCHMLKADDLSLRRLRVWSGEAAAVVARQVTLHRSVFQCRVIQHGGQLYYIRAGCAEPHFELLADDLEFVVHSLNVGPSPEFVPDSTLGRWSTGLSDEMQPLSFDVRFLPSWRCEAINWQEGDGAAVKLRPGEGRACVLAGIFSRDPGQRPNDTVARVAQVARRGGLDVSPSPRWQGPVELYGVGFEGHRFELPMMRAGEGDERLARLWLRQEARAWRWMLEIPPGPDDDVSRVMEARRGAEVILTHTMVGPTAVAPV